MLLFLFKINLLTMSQSLEYKRHTLAHLLAAAVLEYYPKTKLAIGPAIENGFYYDMEIAGLTPEDLPKIEARNFLRQHLVIHRSILKYIFLG